MFLGTISPSSTCSTTTMVSATTKDTVCSTASGTPNRSNGLSSRWATAGSPMRPSRIEHAVMPSCAPASISDRFSPARMTVTALCLPCSAGGARRPVPPRGLPCPARPPSRSRRAEIRANSAPTKNALALNSATVSRTPSQSPIGRPLVGPGAEPNQLDQVDAATVHPHDGGPPAHRLVVWCVGIERRQLDRLTLDRDVAELLQHQTADGVVFALRPTESGGGGHLVDAQQARDQPAVTGFDHIRGGVVVLVADLTDDLLDEVLD